MSAHLEIERKFLIEYPDLTWLTSCLGCLQADIVQTYLCSDDGDEVRVRRWSSGGETHRFRTIKRTITEVTRQEWEQEIDEAEYRRLLQQADPLRRPLRKTRYCLAWRDQLFEIDLYPFWKHQAIAEIELPREDTPIDFPPQLRVIREVTGDPAYRNAVLAAL